MLKWADSQPNPIQYGKYKNEVAYGSFEEFNYLELVIHQIKSFFIFLFI